MKVGDRVRVRACKHPEYPYYHGVKAWMKGTIEDMGADGDVPIGVLLDQHPVDGYRPRTYHFFEDELTVIS